MNRNIDNLGRIVIPKEMRKQLKIKEGDPLHIELVDNKIIITSSEEVDYKAIIEEAVKLLKHQIDILKSKDMLHNGESELLDILNKGLE